MTGLERELLNVAIKYRDNRQKEMEFYVSKNISDKAYEYLKYYVAASEIVEEMLNTIKENKE